MRRENIIDTPHMDQEGMDIPEHVCQSIKSRERLAFTDIAWHSALEVARLHFRESRYGSPPPHHGEPFPELALRLVNQAYVRLKREAKRKGVAHSANDRKNLDYWALPPVLKGVIAGANTHTDRVVGVAKTYMVPSKMKPVTPHSRMSANPKTREAGAGVLEPEWACRQTAQALYPRRDHI